MSKKIPNFPIRTLSPNDKIETVNYSTVKQLPKFREYEELLKKYCADPEQLKNLFAKVESTLEQFRIQCKSTWPKGKPKTITSKNVGDTLESLAHYIFSCTNNIFLPKGSWANDISQFDNILYLTCHECFLIDWKTYTIVECKNWSHPLDKQGVNDFIAKIRDSKHNIGIIFSREGITGKEDYRDAQGKLLLAANEGIIVIIIDDKDLNSLINGKNVFELLEQKYFERRLSPA